MMLEQQKGDTGAVSSLMGCTSLLMGSLGIQLISLLWDNTIIALGIMIFGIAVISLLAWPFVLKQISQPPSPDSIELQKFLSGRFPNEFVLYLALSDQNLSFGFFPK